MQDADGQPIAKTDLSEAVDAARTLLARLADDLDGREDTAARAAVAALRETRPILDRLAGTHIAGDPSDRQAAPAAALTLDVSDLLGYFAHNRLPTGIQRVQAELLYNILSAPAGRASQLCCFVEAREVWVGVSSAKFLEVCAQSRAGGNPQEPGWRKLVDGLRAQIDASPPLAFAPGAVLANIGSSWWLPEYFFQIRALKATYGVLYVPLIHDLIPILMPESCATELVEEFVAWFIGVLGHADFFFANSESTKRDLIAQAAKVGRVIDDANVVVIRLDADFRPLASRPQAAAIPARFDEPYVLLVSTLETRKNQLGAMDAWNMLIAKHGADRVPRLVLVGKLGFQSELVVARVDHNLALRERVSILTGVDDSDLEALYRDCLFTLYPSHYEGWGLPVTEALCHGKVPVIADVSSLPEAGGRFAVYFEARSTVSMTAALERLLYEPGFRQQREQLIRDGFAPGPWADLAQRLIDGVATFRQQAQAPAQRFPAAEPGCYYPLKRSRQVRLWPGTGSAEIYRSGDGWYKLEDHGCWIKPTGADLAMRLAGTRRARLAFDLACAPRCEIRYRVEACGTAAVATGRIADGLRKWVFLDIDDMPADGAIVIRLSATVVEQPPLGWNGDFRPLTIGLSGFFLFGEGDRPSRLDFVEAVALGALEDYNRYQDRSMDV